MTQKNQHAQITLGLPGNLHHTHTGLRTVPYLRLPVTVLTGERPMQRGTPKESRRIAPANAVFR